MWSGSEHQHFLLSSFFWMCVRVSASSSIPVCLDQEWCVHPAIALRVSWKAVQWLMSYFANRPTHIHRQKHHHSPFVFWQWIINNKFWLFPSQFWRCVENLFGLFLNIFNHKTSARLLSFYDPCLWSSVTRINGAASFLGSRLLGLIVAPYWIPLWKVATLILSVQISRDCSSAFCETNINYSSLDIFPNAAWKTDAFKVFSLAGCLIF